ncbi:formyltransferase family protein [Gammaproteobacteria bacterium]|nr:formyltransferase family protein [Gammaproteobacteria bacterium]MDC0442977.1 formyltransferase family protein [Gammaproteobacteria bacterium]
MIEEQTFKINEVRILFFRRDKCNASEMLFEKLKSCGFHVTDVKSKTRGEKLPEDILSWQGEYILCFRSLFILPKVLLDKARIASINFHPAPPEYPGSGCINFALYENVKEYGVTAHIMNEKVDNGKILEVRRFSVSQLDDLPNVLAKTHSALSNLCSDFIDAISLEGKKIIEDKISSSKNEKWNGKAKLLSELDALQTIPLDISKEELKRIVRATYLKDHPPKVEIHGFKFYLHMDE